MATAKPRLTVTLEPEAHAVLRRLSAVQRRPKSALIADLVNQALPVLNDVAATLEALEAATDAARVRMAAKTADDLESAQEALQPLLTGILGFFQGVAAQLSPDGAGGGEGGERVPAAATPPPLPPASAPPASNTGVRPPRPRGLAPVRASRRRPVNV